MSVPRRVPLFGARIQPTREAHLAVHPAFWRGFMAGFPVGLRFPGGCTKLKHVSFGEERSWGGDGPGRAIALLTFENKHRIFQSFRVAKNNWSQHSCHSCPAFSGSKTVPPALPLLTPPKTNPRNVGLVQMIFISGHFQVVPAVTFRGFRVPCPARRLRVFGHFRVLGYLPLVVQWRQWLIRQQKILPLQAAVPSKPFRPDKTFLKKNFQVIQAVTFFYPL